MTFGLAFWILMLLWLVLGLWQNWGGITSGQYWPAGGSLLLFLLLLLLGWRVFGAPLRG
jgi:Na+/proline symporter